MGVFSGSDGLKSRGPLSLRLGAFQPKPPLAEAFAFGGGVDSLRFRPPRETWCSPKPVVHTGPASLGGGGGGEPESRFQPRDVPPDEGDSGSDQTGRVVGKDLGGATPLQLANWSWTDMGAAERQAAEGGWTKAGSKN